MLKILRCCRIQKLLTRNYAKNLEKTEMKYLNVAEKNDAAKTIAGLLSNGSAQRRDGYSVYNKIYDFDGTVKGRNCKMVMTSVSGHLLHLEFLNSYRNWRNVNPQSLFDAPVRKTCSEDFLPIKRTLEREIRSCQGLIIWTDCDREGENIGFEIIDVCRAVKPNIAVYRAKFSEITARAVRRALQQLTTPDKRQSDAVDVRTELDLRTGAAITRFQTMRLQRLFPAKISDKLISYGSCQIPTLGFVAERYKEIEAFVSEPFWKIKVTHTIDDLTVEFNWARNRLFDKQSCEDYLLLCLADPRATVESVTVKPKSKWRPTPMDTVELEKLGSRKLKLSAKETMTIAEKLYTKGIISYPRTETNQFSKEIDLKSLVEQQIDHTVWGSFALRVKEWGPNPRNGNKSDQAHPPIHPTKLVTNLEGNEGRIYELICRHFLACISKDAVGSETVVHINIAGEKFTATGLCIYERNYLDVYIYDKWNAKQIHKYEQGQIFEPTDISMHEGATTAPPLLTEADLIALMDKHGIGTDATHAEHINTIKERGYIGVVDKGSLVPGVIGMGLYEGYDAMELALAKPVLRAEFEADLKRICLGEKDPQVVQREQIQKYKEAYQQIMEKITAMDEKMAQRVNEIPAANANLNANDNSNGENNPNVAQEIFQCPKCTIAPLALKQKKNQTGHFIGCLNFPDCKNAIWLPDECKEFSVLDEHCARCGDTVKLLKLKFQSAFYKSMFNAPFGGWYKTCLRCDAQFRDTFNINLDSVKRVGPIVGDISSEAQSRIARLPNSGVSNSSSSSAAPLNNNNRNMPAPRSGPNQSKSKKPNTKKPTSTDTLKRTKYNTTTAVPTATNGPNSGNIRSFFNSAFSSGSMTTQDRRTTSNQAMVELEGVPLDELFNNNDCFEDIIIPTESSLLTNSTTARTNSNTLTHTNDVDNAGLSASVVAAFAGDDDDFNWSCAEAPPASTTNRECSQNDFNWGENNSSSHARRDSNVRPNSNLDDFDWGTGGSHRTPSAVNSNPLSSRSQPNNDSLSAFFNHDNDFDNYAWGTAARSERGEQNHIVKKPRLSTVGSVRTMRSDVVDDFHDEVMWVPSGLSQENDYVCGAAPQENTIKCTGCHQIAKELTVKKEGPNKGRLFYTCPKSDRCKFFQWADELPQSRNIQAHNNITNAPPPTEASTSSGWGSSRNIINSNPALADSETVNCNCGQAASSLTVRKEGPNKGRPFYACPNRDKSCGFFQWADANDAEAATNSAIRNLDSNWGTAHRNATAARPSTSNAGSNDKREPKKRKCGLCRQEGHTKLKCPRKAEFEY